MNQILLKQAKEELISDIQWLEQQYHLISWIMEGMEETGL